jgi:hypothetical protein
VAQRYLSPAQRTVIIAEPDAQAGAAQDDDEADAAAEHPGADGEGRR